MNFSIVFPTRNRHHLLRNLLESVELNTEDLDRVEVLIAVDEDDKETQTFLLSSNYSFAKMFIVKRSLNFSQDYYTYLAKQSRGRWIITANDDCVFETKCWDAIAYKYLADKPSVIYGWIEDGLGEWRAKGHGNYCCFPLQGRGGFEALGYIFPARIPTWGADLWARSLYDQVRSVVELPITIKHICYHNKTREQDEVNKHIQSNQVHFDLRPGYDEVNKLISAIKQEKVAA